MIIGLRLFFALVLASMLWVTTWASLRVPLWELPREVAAHPWFIATLVDTYWAFLTFYCWVFYKESSWLSRGAWLVAILLLGNIAMAIYMLVKLMRLPSRAPVERLLLRGAAVFCLCALPQNAYADDLRQRADALDRAFQAKEALQCYMQLEERDGPTAEVKILIARQHAYLMNSKSTKAEKISTAQQAVRCAEQAVELDPRSSDAHLALAICLGKLTPMLGNREMIAAAARIKTSAQRAVDIDARCDLGWHILGRWQQGAAEVGGVTRALATVIYGEVPKGSNEEALRCFQKAMQLNNRRPVHVLELGCTLAQMGREEEAKRYLQQGLAMPNLDFDDPESKQRAQQTLNSLK